jgi:hypothetical protein
MALPTGGRLALLALMATLPHKAAIRDSYDNELLLNVSQGSEQHIEQDAGRPTTTLPFNQTNVTTTETEEVRSVGKALFTQVAVQLLFALIYFFMMVRHYPVLTSDSPPPSQEAIDVQKKNEIAGMMDASWTNLCLSCCCLPSRAAHTVHATNVCGFWPACLLVSVWPGLALCYFTTMTDLQAKLGGESKGCIRGCLCSCFCTCCVIAHDAHTLDLITGVPTKICGTGQ